MLGDIFKLSRFKVVIVNNLVINIILLEDGSIFSKYVLWIRLGFFLKNYE